jgi:DNA-binding Lrp family transcriptional regulator
MRLRYVRSLRGDPGHLEGQTMLDAIDTQIVECLQVDGRASWTQIARQIGVPTSTAFRRGMALLEGNAILIATLPTLEMYPEHSRVYEIRLRCRRGATRSVARRLAGRNDSRWVAAVTGEFNVSAELVVPPSADLAEILIDQIQGDPDVLAVDTTMVLAEHHVANDWPQRFPAYEQPPQPEHVCSSDHFDATDRAILAELSHDGRRSYAAVAAVLDLSENTVRRRCMEMFQRRCARVATLVRPHSLGYHEELLIRLDVAPGHTDAAIEILTHQNGVHHIASNLGAPSLVCELMLKSHRDIRTFVPDVIARLPGLTGMSVEIELVVYKRGFLRCPWVRDEGPGDIGLRPARSEAGAAALNELAL